LRLCDFVVTVILFTALPNNALRWVNWNLKFFLLRACFPHFSHLCILWWRHEAHVAKCATHSTCFWFFLLTSRGTELHTVGPRFLRTHIGGLVSIPGLFAEVVTVKVALGPVTDVHSST